jgi:hypothetical protein
MRYHVRMTKKRLDYYRPQRTKLSRRLMNQIKLHKLGHFAGRAVWVVDGSVVRAYVDIDFALGGNPARYSYVPAGELWVEDTGDENDVRATAVHEAVETAHMLDGMSYDAAHDLASAQETRLRTTGKGMPVFVPNPQESFFHVIGYGHGGQQVAHDMQSEPARAKYTAMRMLRDDFDVLHSAVFVGTLEEHEAQPIAEFFAQVPVAMEAEQASNGYYSYWISPDGDIYPVEPYKHVEVESRLVKFLLVPRTQETMTSYSPALAAGWLQISEEEGGVLYGFDRELGQRQLDAVFDLAQEHKARVWSQQGGRLHEVFWQSAMKWLNAPAATRNPAEETHTAAEETAEEIAEHGHYGFWLAPDGRCFVVEAAGEHGKVAREIAARLLGVAGGNPEVHLENMGWLRCAGLPLGFVVLRGLLPGESCERPLAQRQLDTLFDLQQALHALSGKSSWKDISRFIKHEVEWASRKSPFDRNPSEPEHIKTVCMYCKKVIFDGPLDSSGMVSHAVCYDCAVEHAEEIGFIQEDLEGIRIAQGR